MKRIIIFILIAISGLSVTLNAQTSGGNCIGFLSNIETETSNLTQEQQKSLKLKVDQIITRNRVATTALYNAFIITPQIDIISEESLTMGIRPVNSIVAEVTLIASNSVDKSVYGSITVEVKASGNSRDAAIGSIISSLRPTDPRFAKFISSSVSQISNYYSLNMPTIIQKTETMIAGNRYDDAVVFLESIPTCVPSYQQSSEAIQELYKIVSDKNCYAAITMAERHIVLGDYEQAKTILLGVEPGSECDTKVTELIGIVADSLKNQPRETPLELSSDEREKPERPKREEKIECDETEVIERPSRDESAVISNTLKHFDVSFVSCKANSNDNTITITLMVRNVSDLPYSFRMYRYNRSTFAYNDEGDTFYCPSIRDDVFTLQADMPRKVELSFSRIPTSNNKLSVQIGAHDDGNATIKISNMDISW